jgi:ribosomal protein L40E
LRRPVHLTMEFAGSELPAFDPALDPVAKMTSADRMARHYAKMFKGTLDELEELRRRMNNLTIAKVAGIGVGACFVLVLFRDHLLYLFGIAVLVGISYYLYRYRREEIMARIDQIRERMAPPVDGEWRVVTEEKQLVTEETQEPTIHTRAADAPQKLLAVEVTYCGKCGAQLPPEAGFCPECGARRS